MTAVDAADPRLLEFVAGRRWGVLATVKHDGRPQLSNVLHAVGPDGVIRVSTTAGRAKYRNLARDPWTALHVTQDDFWAYVVFEGAFELAPIIASVDDPGGEGRLTNSRRNRHW